MIIIKVDDLKSDAHGGVPERWQRFVDYIKEHKLHAGIGIICDSLEVDKPAYFNWIKQLQASGSFEIWFHGWDHAPHTEME